MHIVFDDYPQPSIKETERNRWGAKNRTFVITGPEKHRVPRNLNDALKSKFFKRELIQFLADMRQCSSYTDIKKKHGVILDVPGQCYSFKVEDGIFVVTLQRPCIMIIKKLIQRSVFLHF